MKTSLVSKPTFRFYFAASVLCYAVALTGCGNNLVEVSGVVTVDGEPTPGVNLRFFPEGNSIEALPSSTKSLEGGKFSLTTNAETGIPVGKYKLNADWPDPNFKPKKKGGLDFGDPQPPPDKLNGKYMNDSEIIDITGATTDLKIDLKSR